MKPSARECYKASIVVVVVFVVAVELARRNLPLRELNGRRRSQLCPIMSLCCAMEKAGEPMRHTPMSHRPKLLHGLSAAGHIGPLRARNYAMLAVAKAKYTVTQIPRRLFDPYFGSF